MKTKQSEKTCSLFVLQSPLLLGGIPSIPNFLEHSGFFFSSFFSCTRRIWIESWARDQIQAASATDAAASDHYPTAWGQGLNCNTTVISWIINPLCHKRNS